MEKNSYKTILKSSSLIGGATAINYAIGLAKTKIVAVLLGPSGVGLVGMYGAITGMVGTISSLGITSSGTRQIAEANAKGDSVFVEQTASVLRKLCWITGILGWLLSAAFAWLLSLWTFGNTDHIWAITLLGATLLLGSISAGQSCLIQGMRRIADLAKMQVAVGLLNTIAATTIYLWLGTNGIVPALIVTAIIQLLVSWWFSRKLSVASVPLKLKDAFNLARPLIHMGIAFMWAGLIGALVAFGIRAIITRELGLDANGIYQAAWNISGMFAGFVLGSMGADFFPRLTGVADDHDALNRMVNEQAEVAILLSLPGLVASLAFADWIILLLYSNQFTGGSDLLAWFVFGVFGQIISWPMGFILLAKGESRWFAAVETFSGIVRLILSALFVNWMGLVGAAIAIPVMYGFHTIAVAVLAMRITDFWWTSTVLRMALLGGVTLAFCFVIRSYMPEIIGVAANTTIFIVVGIICLRGLHRRTGTPERLRTLIQRLGPLRHLVL